MISQLSPRDCNHIVAIQNSREMFERGGGGEEGKERKKRK